jgi:hypothetical protein
MCDVEPDSKSAHVVFRAVGHADMPAPLLGPGRVELVGDEIRLHGARTRTLLPVLLGCLTGVLGIALASVVLSMAGLELHPGQQRTAFGIGAVTGLLPGILVHGWLSSLKGRQVELCIPLSAIRVLTRQPNTLFLRMATHETRGEVEIVARDDAAVRLLSLIREP